MSTQINANRLYLLGGLAILLLGAGCNKKPVAGDSAAKPDTTMPTELNETQKVHVTLGYSIGADLMLETYTSDEVDQILAGLRMASKGEKPEYVDDMRNQAFEVLNEKRTRQARERQEGALTENKAAGEAFLAGIDKKEGVVKTASGLRYEILKAGSDKFATAADSVNVHYHGTLVDGTVFDSSVDRNEPVTFPLNGVIPGFSEGLTLIGEGGKIRLYMPSDIAYGDRDSGGPIGPGSTLVFEVELLEINP
jgi:FKBP-type peptidyl-prolyl cis-trans isomerase